MEAGRGAQHENEADWSNSSLIELNVHAEIERGDNATVKQAAQSLQDGKCCSA